VLHAADGPSGEALCRASQFEIDVLVAWLQAGASRSPHASHRPGAAHVAPS
jgi:hypothetical protein